MPLIDVSVKSRALDLYSNVQSSIIVARVLGLNARTVRGWIKRAGISQGRRAAGLRNIGKAQSVRSAIRDGYQKNSNELAYVVGILLGDGSISNRGSIRLNVVDKEFADAFFLALETLLGRTPYRGILKKKLAVFPNGKSYTRRKQYLVTVGSIKGSKFLQQCKSKEWIAQLSAEQKLLLIRGLWDSEGCVRLKHKHMRSVEVIFYNSEKWIAWTFADLLAELEISPTVRYDGKLWIVRFGKHDDVVKFYETVQPTIGRKRVRFEEALARWKTSTTES